MNNSVHSSKALFRGALILTIGAIITKILSAFYRIPFQNIVGDVGFYIYQQVYPFYAIAVVLSTTGFPVVISKLYAERIEKGEEKQSRLLLLISFLFLQVVGIFIFLILFLGANQIAFWMKDPQLFILLRVVSVVFLIFPTASILRGYYQAAGDMVPTALSQVGEQTVRVLTIIILSYVLMKNGSDLYLVGGSAMFGSITGSLIAVFLLFMFLWIRKEWKVIKPTKEIFQSDMKHIKHILRELTVQGTAICLCGMLLIFLQLGDALNLYSLLVSNGAGEHAAKSLKGIFDRGQPLIQLGTVAATSMSLTLVPLLTTERIQSRSDLLYQKIQLALKVSIVIGLAASAGLWSIIEPTNIMLFKNAEGSSVLGVLSFIILFTSIILTAVSIFQGLGKVLFPAIAVLTAFPVKFAFNILLVPRFGTMGAAFASVLTLIIITSLLLLVLRKIIAAPILHFRFFSIVIGASCVMVVFLKGYLWMTNVFDFGRLGAAIQALTAVGLGGFLFLFIVIRAKIFQKEELSLFPFGSKLMMFLPKLDRR